MSTGLIDIMKRASLDAAEDAKFTDIRYGTVSSVSPLKVQLTQEFVLPASILVVPQHLTDYTVDVTIDWSTDSGGSHEHTFSGTTKDDEHEFEGTTDESKNHSHKVSGKKTMTIHNALQVGDRVALLRKQGGQSYFILDRI